MYCTDGKLVQVQLGKSGHGSIETKNKKNPPVDKCSENLCGI